MNKMLRVLSCRDLKTVMDGIAGKVGVEVEYFSDDSTEILEKIAFVQPDAVFLKLFMPDADAIEIIKAYKSLYADSFTCFVVVSPFVTCGLRRDLEGCGVNKIITSSSDARELEKNLTEILRVKASSVAIKRSAGIHAIHRLHHRSGQGKSLDAESLVDGILDALGFAANSKGYRYLRKAVLVAVSKGNESVSVTKLIYPAVSAEFHTTPSCVERHIRGTIADAWQSDGGALIAAYFGNTVDNMRGKPSNSEFIAMLADRIYLDLL